MFYSIIVELNITKDICIPKSSGEQMNAVFYTLLQKYDKTTFDILHKKNSYKPFTVSPLFANYKIIDSETKVKINKSMPIWFRITFMTDELFLKFTKAVKNNKITKIKINGEELNVKIIYFTNDRHKLASFITTNELMNTKLHNAYTFKLITPTTFSKDNKNYPFPDEEIFFKSLMRKWNYFTKSLIDVETEKKLLNNIKLGKFKIESKRYHFSKYNKIGFIGEVEYKIYTNSKKLRKLFNTLSKFSFYSGVGSKTTMGMGQTSVRIVE